MKSHFASEYRELVQWHWWFRGREKILRSILESERVSPASIAVLGCGPAEGARWLRTLAPRIVAVDIDLNQARGSDSFLHYVVGSAEASPLRRQSFDAVLALDVLEHLDDDVRGLGQAVDLLKDGGLLVVTVPALPALWGAQDVVSEHRRRYTKGSLRRLFDRAELARPRINYFNTFLFPLIAAVRWTRRLTRMSASRSDFEDNRPGLVNDVLAAIFASERHLVPRVPLPIGASLLAVWRKPD